MGHHLGEQRGLVNLRLPLLRLRQHREQPVEFIGRRRVVEAPREASRVDPEILWQVHVPESTMPLTHLRAGHKKPRPEAVGVSRFDLRLRAWKSLPSRHHEAAGGGGHRRATESQKVDP